MQVQLVFDESEFNALQEVEVEADAALARLSTDADVQAIEDVCEIITMILPFLKALLPFICGIPLPWLKKICEVLTKALPILENLCKK